MKRCIRVACVLAAVWMMSPVRADSAGVYENAAAESAFLLAPDTISVRASLETTSGQSTDATVYRFYAAFPVRHTFLVAIEQPLVSVSTASRIESGMGDFTARLRARLSGGPRRAVLATAVLGTGTGEERFYPYATQSIDFSLSAAFTDSLGGLAVWALGGYAWAQRVPDALAAEHVDARRFSAGVSAPLGKRAALRAGVTYFDYIASDGHRELLFAGSSYAWTPKLRLLVEGQVETGPLDDRASDWGVTLGVSAWF
jgi:hypothetical protein